MKNAIALDTPWLTIEEFIQRNRIKAPTARVWVMELARRKRIPGAKKVNGHWLFHREKSDTWDETK
jgi:hypothetical protein